MSSSTVEIIRTDEEVQIQKGIQINTKLIAKQVVQEQLCHFCPKQTKMTNPVSFTFESGVTVQFCNNDELNAWKQKYNR